MFGIFIVDCTLWLDKTSVDCKNFTVYKDQSCDGYCWKTLWLCSSIATSTICIFLMCQRINPNLRPVDGTVVAGFLLRKPFFWSIGLLLSLVIIYDLLIIRNNEDAKIAVEVLVILSKCFTAVVIFQLNYTMYPSRNQGFNILTVMTYYVCLSLYVLDNFLKFATVSAQVAFKFYDVTNKSSVNALRIIDLTLMLTNGLLYQRFMQFFWDKIFLGEKDILMVYRENFVDNLNKFVNCQNHEETIDAQRMT